MKQCTIAMAIVLGLTCHQAQAQFFQAANTPEAAAGHAMADLIRTQGLYNEMTSGAMINVEVARGKFIDNQRAWTELYLTRRRILESQHGRALELARARNARHQEEQAGHSDLPPRLLSSQLDPSTGRIAWPAALMRETFAIERGDIEAILADRAQMGSSSELTSALNFKVREMQEELKFHIREIVTQEYLDARRFLDSLSLESRFPVENQATALR